MVLFKKARLSEALGEGDIETMKAMLEKGVDPNHKDGYGNSFLVHAIQGGNHDAVRLLIEKGALVDEKAAGYQGTALHVVARQGSLEIAEVLLRKNPALLGSKNSEGDTALHVAAQKGFADLVEWLIEKGANPHQKNFNNRTPLFLAQKERHDDAVTVLRRHMELHPPVPKPALEQVAAPAAAPAPAAVSAVQAADTAAEEDWKKLPGERIATVRVESAIGYRITEIFNFSARERTSLYQNLETKMETVETRAFDQIGDKASLEKALHELRQRGGTADAGSISGIDKKKIEGPKPSL